MLVSIICSHASDSLLPLKVPRQHFGITRTKASIYLNLLQPLCGKRNRKSFSNCNSFTLYIAEKEAVLECQLDRLYIIIVNYAKLLSLSVVAPTTPSSTPL